jgi:hypothetical protein
VSGWRLGVCSAVNGGSALLVACLLVVLPHDRPISRALESALLLVLTASLYWSAEWAETHRGWR